MVTKIFNFTKFISNLKGKYSKNAYTSKDKLQLDSIIERYKAQPVGWGYIDIIVRRENYKEFLNEVIHAGFSITCITWWECIENKRLKNRFWYWWPISIYYSDTWFSELCHWYDEINYPIDTVENLYQIIENKRILNHAEQPLISFLDDIWLTPAFWIDVPDSWRNLQDYKK